MCLEDLLYLVERNGTACEELAGRAAVVGCIVDGRRRGGAAAVRRRYRLGAGGTRAGARAYHARGGVDAFKRGGPQAAVPEAPRVLAGLARRHLPRPRLQRPARDREPRLDAPGGARMARAPGLLACRGGQSL